MLDFPLFPDQASTIASRVDALYFFLIAVSAFFSVLIFGLIFYFAVKYRSRPGIGARQLPNHLGLELFWTAVPFGITMVMFTWGTSLYIRNSVPPRTALNINVVGRQWMWKVQHPEGRREINELHVPVGQPVKLTMASEDVIHSFFIPAFRVKHDVVPGRYSTMWFQATTTGEYHLFCAEYCGVQHSGMIGKVVVMEPDEFEKWLEGGTEENPVETGAKLFSALNCANCHQAGAKQRCPHLENQFGKTVALQGGGTAIFDESYIRESIITPNAKIVAGYSPLMPTFRGQVTEEQIIDLIAYIKSLSTEQQDNQASTPSGTKGNENR
jgi:cytochrome c oxidase subunit 2